MEPVYYENFFQSFGISIMSHGNVIFNILDPHALKTIEHDGSFEHFKFVHLCMCTCAHVCICHCFYHLRANRRCPNKVVREHLPRQETFSSGHCPNYQEVGPIFLNVKNDVLARITEPSNNDYDNGVSDDCDHNFGTFDDFGVKNDQQVSHNMILMSKYKGQHGGKRVKKFGQGPPPPKENVFL